MTQSKPSFMYVALVFLLVSLCCVYVSLCCVCVSLCCVYKSLCCDTAQAKARVVEKKIITQRWCMHVYFFSICGWLVCLIHMWYFIAKRTSTDALSFCSAKLFALSRIYPLLLLFINFRIFCIHQRKKLSHNPGILSCPTFLTPDPTYRMIGPALPRDR